MQHWPISTNHVSHLSGETSFLAQFPSALASESRLVCKIQCRHSIPVLNAWAAQTLYMARRPIATQFPRYGCMDDLTAERSFDMQATWVIDVLQGLSCNASSVSFGHAEHCFLTVWTPKSLCQNLLKMAFLRR